MLSCCSGARACSSAQSARSAHELLWTMALYFEVWCVPIATRLPAIARTRSAMRAGSALLRAHLTRLHSDPCVDDRVVRSRRRRCARTRADVFCTALTAPRRERRRDAHVCCAVASAVSVVTRRQPGRAPKMDLEAHAPIVAPVGPTSRSERDDSVGRCLTFIRWCGKILGRCIASSPGPACAVRLCAYGRAGPWARVQSGGCALGGCPSKEMHLAAR